MNLSTIKNEQELFELMTKPKEDLIAFFKDLEGDLMILGIGGKIGWTIGGLAVNSAKEAGNNLKVYGVSRFSKQDTKKELENIGLITIACDLGNEEEVQKLPKVKNIIFMAGKKFGTTGDENNTWAMNTIIPTFVAKHFKDSNILVFSTGCVYDFVDKGSGGSIETDILTPLGEYANSCIGRERVFSYFSVTNHTPVCIFRLNYAVEARYGVIREIVDKILNDEEIDLSMGQVNVMWQGDVARYALLLLNECKSPREVYNVTGPETVSIKSISKYIGNKVNKEVKLVGDEENNVLLSNSSKLFSKFGYPEVTLNEIIDITCDWALKGGKKLDKLTHYETRNGSY